ncbi:MAG: S8 family serine peptidase, partial [Thermoanaerobaculia bacterium]
MKLRVLTAIALACAALPALAERYIVEFRPRSGIAASSTDTLQRFRADLERLAAPAAAASRAASSATVLRGFDVLFDGAAIELDRASTIREILALPYVTNVHLDREVTAGPVIEEASAATAAGVATHAGGNDVVVAVIDSGVDYNHPALGGGFGPGRKVRGGYDFVNDDADPMDDNRHGTHVAGIIAAKSAELTGIAPEVSLLAYKVLDAKGKGAQSHVIAALERAVDPDGNGDFSDRARVINLSLGSAGHPDDPVSKAVDRASALGVVVVVSVGNTGEEHSIASPALARTALAVGAVDGGREIAEFSARGPAAQSSAPRPDVLAPGVLIRSAAIGGGTLTLSGTSMAAPYVAGLAARIIEGHPAWSSERVRSAIIYSSYPVPGAPVMAQGAGVVDIPTALSSSVFIEPSPLGFGVLDRRTATWRAQRTIRLRSDFDVAVTMRAEAGALPEGVTITATPAEIELRPGVETVVTVDIEVDVAKVDAGQPGLAFGGWLKLVRGAVDAYVPWGVVRAGRVRTTVPHEFPQLVWSTNGVARGSIVSLDPYTHEALLEPATYDLAMVAEAEGETRVFVRERLVVDGDLQVEFTTADAPHQVRWEATDPAGALLSAGASESRLYSMAGRLLFAEGTRKWSIELPASMEALRSSSFGGRWSLLLTESVVDMSRNEIVVAQHPPVVALAADAVLRTSSADYRSQRVEAVFPRDAPERNIYLMPRWLTRR